MDKQNEDRESVSIPYFIHEGEMYRLERANKRWFISFLIVLAMLFLTNAGWIAYESQYETYRIEQDVDTGTGDAAVAGIGDVNYGESKTADHSPSQENQQ